MNDGQRKDLIEELLRHQQYLAEPLKAEFFAFDLSGVATFESYEELTQIFFDGVCTRLRNFTYENNSGEVPAIILRLIEEEYRTNFLRGDAAGTFGAELEDHIRERGAGRDYQEFLQNLETALKGRLGKIAESSLDKPKKEKPLIKRIRVFFFSILTLLSGLFTWKYFVQPMEVRLFQVDSDQDNGAVAHSNEIEGLAPFNRFIYCKDLEVLVKGIESNENHVRWLTDLNLLVSEIRKSDLMRYTECQDLESIDPATVLKGRSFKENTIKIKTDLLEPVSKCVGDKCP